MFKFILRKMLNKKWMVLALLIGNLLLAGITSTNPMYTRAVLQRMLMTEFTDTLADINQYPMIVTASISPTSDYIDNIFVAEEMVDDAVEAIGLPLEQYVKCYWVSGSTAESLQPRGDDPDSKHAAITMMEDLENHISIKSGKMYASERGEDGVIEVIVSEKCYNEKQLLLGDELVLTSTLDPDGNPVTVRVVGVFEQASLEDNYWVRTPTYYREYLFMDPTLFRELFMNEGEMTRAVNGIWYVLPDYTAMRGEDVPRIIEATQQQIALFDDLRDAQLRVNYSSLLEDFERTASKVEVTLWVLQVPIFMLLAVFIFMVSRQMLEMEEGEIAVLKSRGAGKGQIITLYFLQSVILAAVGCAGGVPLGVFLCQVLGSSNSFMEFVSRSALDVQISAEAVLYAAAASLLSVAAMTLPVIRYSNVSIVNHKQRKQRRGADRPMWQKLYLDFAVLAVSLYGLYNFNGQKDYLAQKVLDGASLDPLLFLCSSLFMIGAALVAVRLLPWIAWLVFTLFKKQWSPALYASFQRILRTRKSQNFIMVFLIITIALGVFNSDAARTINTNEEENIRYTIGADITLQEKWGDNSGSMGADDELVYTEPDFEPYEEIEGAASVAKVLINDGIKATVGGSRQTGVKLIAIDTKAFGETIDFNSTLNPLHINAYLNAISQNTRAVLVSSNFRTNYNMELGDSIYYQSGNSSSIKGVICGFVDYFPTYAPTGYETGTDGIETEVEKYLIVAHLSQVQAEWGVTPYQIWIKSEDGDTQFIYDFIEESGKTITKFKDMDAKLVELKNDPVFQGTNGVLTVGFIVVLLLCIVGFLIYWVLSIKSRALQFGIFRAMGLSMREILTMLLNEHLYISGLAVAAGFAVGKLTAKLYMPLIQLAYATADNAIPLKVVSDSSDLIRIGIIVGAMLLVCLTVLGVLISRMKIAQALKLGED